MISRARRLAAPAELATSVAGTAVAITAVGTSAAALHPTYFMTTAKITAVAAAIVVVAAVIWIVKEHRTNDALRTRIAQLSATENEAIKLRTENARLAEQKIAAEAEVASQRAEIARIRQAIAAKRAAAANAERVRTDEAAAANTHQAPDAKRSAGMIPVDLMTNMGRATASAAAQTELWATRHGDVDTIAGLITFEPADRARLEAFLTTVPDNIRSQYGTPERLMAFVMAGSPRPIAAVEVLNETASDPDTIVHRVAIQRASGEVQQDEVKFHRTPEGWQHVISPGAVDRVIAYFRGQR